MGVSIQIIAVKHFVFNYLCRLADFHSTAHQST